MVGNRVASSTVFTALITCTRQRAGATAHIATRKPRITKAGEKTGPERVSQQMSHSQQQHHADRRTAQRHLLQHGGQPWPGEIVPNLSGARHAPPCRPSGHFPVQSFPKTKSASDAGVGFLTS